MPFSLIPTVLGASFALIWIFIGAMILRDGQFAIRRERETGCSGPQLHPRQDSPRHPHWRPSNPARRRAAGRNTSPVPTL